MQVDWLLSQPEVTRAAALNELQDEDQRALDSYLCKWNRPEAHGGARDKQREPAGEWFIWLLQCGRGFGKTRTGAETVKTRTELDPKDPRCWRVVNIAGPTWMDVMDTMVEGTDVAPGLMRLWPKHRKPKLHLGERPHIETWNGAHIRLRSADNAERFRGPQADGGWVDEVDAWAPKKMTGVEAFALFEMGIRLGRDPRIIVTTTPKRGKVVANLRGRDDMVLTTGTLEENRQNLAPQFIKAVTNRYGGTSLGKQELEGILLEEVEGAVVKLATLAANRRPMPSQDKIKRLVIAVDPSGGEDGDAKSDEKGIVVVGLGKDNHGYMLRDLSTQRGPEGWGEQAVRAALSWGAEKIIGEANYGGAMVASTCRAAAKSLGVPCPRIEMVSASRGKAVRFSPVGALINRGLLHICEDDPQLDMELTGFTETSYEGEGSPNRADALVWAVTDLMLEHEAGLQIF